MQVKILFKNYQLRFVIKKMYNYDLTMILEKLISFISWKKRIFLHFINLYLDFYRYRGFYRVEYKLAPKLQSAW